MTLRAAIAAGCAALAAAPAAADTGDVTGAGAVTAGVDTVFALHGYARMPLSLEATPREPWLIDNDYYLSGFAYTRLYEPDWSELFLTVRRGDYRAQFGLFASLYSDYATTELENQLGIAQASVAADRFLGQAPLSVELGVFWDRFGYLEPYDTYLFGRTHQGGFKLRWDLGDGGYVQAGAGAHRERLQQNQGLTPVAHVAGGYRIGRALVSGYLLRTWTRDKRQLSPIEDGTLWVVGADVRVDLPGDRGWAYAGAAYYDAERVLFLAPALELLHSTGGRGLAENFLGTADSGDGTGSLTTFAVDAPVRIAGPVSARLFGMTTWVRSEQVVPDDPLANKDRRLYVKWGAEPSYALGPHVRASLRYDRVILDFHDAANSFRALSPKLAFPLADWGELFVQYTHYWYGDKIALRPGQVPLESEPDANVFKVQAQAAW
ncbi:MAG: hypothetical protein D6689_22285 [Deltaproteobacteria bacterium]|nr:MAG: hypothetical protein D6689_22285 [Deltaproteobacteria bacterium]